MTIYILLGYKYNEEFEEAKERLLKDLGEKMPIACFARSLEEMSQTIKEMEE